MKTNVNAQQLVGSISKFFHRYHVLIFVIFVMGGLATATFFLSQTMTPAASTDQSAAQAGFDKAAIKKIESLRGENDPSTPLTMPAGRTNPFQ